jgi:hypothetical protein
LVLDNLRCLGAMISQLTSCGIYNNRIFETIIDIVA